MNWSKNQTRNIKYDIYNELIKEPNKAFKREIKNNSGLRYWRIFGVKKSGNSVFVDGVHFNDHEGMPQYLRSLRDAVIQAIIQVQNYNVCLYYLFKSIDYERCNFSR